MPCKCYFLTSWIFTNVKKKNCINVICSGKASCRRASVYVLWRMPICRNLCTAVSLGFKFRFQHILVLHSIDLLEHEINRCGDIQKHFCFLSFKSQCLSCMLAVKVWKRSEKGKFRKFVWKLHRNKIIFTGQSRKVRVHLQHSVNFCEEGPLEHFLTIFGLGSLSGTIGSTVQRQR